MDAGGVICHPNCAILLVTPPVASTAGESVPSVVPHVSGDERVARRRALTSALLYFVPPSREYPQ